MKTKEVKNGTSRLHVCNGEKLAKILVKKGLNAREFSAELGYHATYLPKVIRTNKIGETAVGLLLSKGIKPTQYDVDMETTVKSKDPVGGLDEAERRFNEKLADFEVNNKKYDGAIMEEIVKRNSGRYPWGTDEKSPAELAMDEPGVVKIEMTLDMVKLKAIVKQAVKEAYEEL